MIDNEIKNYKNKDSVNDEYTNSNINNRNIKDRNIKKRDIKITDSDRKLSKPLSILDIPTRTPQFEPSDTITHKYTDKLDITPEEGIFFYLKIPGLIFFATIGGYLIGRFKFNFLYILFIGYIIYFIYNRKVRKFSDSLKSLINYKTRKEKSKYIGETVEWLNNIIEKFWEVAEPVVSNDICQNVNRELLKVCPPFLNGLKLTKFTLGNRPPYIERITYYNSKEDKIILDVSIGFVPIETSVKDLNYFLGDKKNWNSTIILNARLGTRNGIGIDLPIMVKEIHFVGRIRTVINLVSKNLFIKDIEICMMEVPEFDFTLIPLKTVDIMDVPGLSKWIRKTIIKVMNQMIINPNSIVLDIEKIAQSQGQNIGVVCVQILTLENEKNEKVYGEIDIDNRIICQTSTKQGRNIVYNEYFYMIVQNVDEKIGLTFYSSRSERSIGGIFLKNVHTEPVEEHMETDIKMDTKIVKIIPCKRNDPRRIIYNKIRLIKEEETYAYLNANLSYYPIQKKKANSAIVSLKLIGVDNLVGKYGVKSSYCTIIVSPLNKDQTTLPMEHIRNTNHMTAMVVSGVCKLDEEEINISGKDMDNLLSPSSSTFYIFESKRVFNTNSPNYNQTFEFFSRDISVDVCSICVVNEKTSEISGRVGLSLQDVVPGRIIKYKLKDARSGSIELKFDFNYIDLKEKIEDSLDYISMQKITVESVSEQGVFYGVVETNTDCFFMEPFTSVLPIKKSIYVPVHEDDMLKFRLFKETIHGDVFIGEEELSINYSKEAKKTALILSDTVSVTLKVEGEELNEYRGITNENLKVVQIKLGTFYGLNEEVFIEFRNQDGIIKASSFSRDKQINSVFTIITGNEDLYAIIKSGDQGENRILGRCDIPKRFANEKIMLNEYGLAVDIKVNIQTCEYPAVSNLKKGILEVYIKTVKNLKLSTNGLINAFIKVLANDKKVHKTKTIKGSVNPTFYESFSVDVDKLKDVFTIQVYDEIRSKQTLICFVEFPLYNINEGFSEVECRLLDAKTFQWNGSTINLGFNFCRDPNAVQVKKRGLLDGLF